MTRIKSQAGLAAALGSLADRDARLGELWRRAGTPPLRRRPADFTGLLRVIVGQQLSARAAATIWDRLLEATAPLSPATFLEQPEARLRTLGLSRQKIAFGRCLAANLASGALALPALARVADEEAIAALTEIRGIGRWTAECFLLFAQGRPDIWPSDDLALAVACQRLLALPERPRPQELTAISAGWSPWRSAAARLLWHGYGKQVL